MDMRSYGIGAQILADLGVHDMLLLSNTEKVLVALEGFGLSIVGRRPIPEGIVSDCSQFQHSEEFAPLK